MSSLDRAVEVMDRLRSPGGCPWDAAQTHRSLTRYLLEEAYEVIEAIETDDLALLREELGDLLLQVLFHARLTQELPPEQAFGIEEIAADLTDKLVRRHPHVFDGADAGSPDQLNETWERQKIAEKRRTSCVDGVPLDQPALALSAKLVARAERAGLGAVRPADSRWRDRADGRWATADHADGDDGADGADIGRRLLAIVREAVAAGIDPESALRRTARDYREALMRAEAGREIVSPGRWHGGSHRAGRGQHNSG